MTVLVTGGAGYIGSHMVYALVAAGERVVVLDNLSTGFDWAIAEGVPLVMGETGDQALVSALIRQHGVEVDHPFRGLDRGAGFGFRSARLLQEQHGEFARADRVRRQGRREAFHLLLDRRRVRQSGARAGDRGRPHGADVALRLVQADDRDHAARRRFRAWSRARHPALLQRRGRRPRIAHRAIDQGRDASDQGRGRDRARPAREDGRVRHRLSDARRDLRARLHPRQRSGAGASRCACAICAAAAHP